MDTNFRLLPPRASTLAPEVDALYFYLVGASVVMVILIAGLIVYFSIKYRRGSPADRSPVVPAYRVAVETVYIGAPLFVFGSMFFWGAILFFDGSRPPDGALEIHVVGKQWMWKLQHPNGRREINELHVPLGTSVRLVMISQDVIHSFFIPAFRVKQDVLPGRYVESWFQAAELGEFRLLCAEYCGTDHSRMIGRVVVMEPSQYDAWLAGANSQEPPAVAGARRFEELRCATCHRGAAARCPALEKLYGSEVKLQDGRTVIADDNYLRESILHPLSQVVAGYQPLMPSFEGQVDEQGLLDLIAYIKSLPAEQGTGKP